MNKVKHDSVGTFEKMFYVNDEADYSKVKKVPEIGRSSYSEFALFDLVLLLLLLRLLDGANGGDLFHFFHLVLNLLDIRHDLNGLGETYVAEGELQRLLTSLLIVFANGLEHVTSSSSLLVR